MKKKIKDLTKDEIKNICHKHDDCEKCPFYIYGENCKPYLMEEEVEVDD